MIRDLLHKIPMRYYVGAFFYGVSVNGLKEFVGFAPACLLGVAVFLFVVDAFAP